MQFGTLFRKSEDQSADAPIDFKSGNIPLNKAAALVGMDVETFSRHCTSMDSLGAIMPIRPGDAIDAADLYTYLYRREHSGKLPHDRETFTLEEMGALLDVPIEVVNTLVNTKGVYSQMQGTECVVFADQVKRYLENSDKPERRLRQPGYVPKIVRDWRREMQMQEETDGKQRSQARADGIARATNEFNRLLGQFEPEAVAEALAVLNKSKSD